MLWNFKYPEADNRQTLRRKGHSNCYRNGMLTHTIHETERRCADYTFSLGIVCTQATPDAVAWSNICQGGGSAWYPSNPPQQCGTSTRNNKEHKHEDGELGKGFVATGLIFVVSIKSARNFSE